MSLIFVFTIPVGPGHTKRLRATLSSLRAQDAKVRVALCNAGNSQACAALASEYSDIVKYFRQGPDQGQSDAINEGWESLDGDVYSWLNADDYLVPNILGKVSDTLTLNKTIDIVYGQSLIFEDDNQLKGIHPAVTDDISLITYSNIISQPSCFYRKSLLDELGLLKTELDYTMDWELWVRFYKAGKTFHYMSDIISCVIWETGTKTSNINRARMKEIYALTRTSHGYWRALKTQIGFTLHYLQEYSPVRTLLQRLTRALKAKTKQDRSHWIPAPATPQNANLPIFSFDPKTMTSIDLVYARTSTPYSQTSGRQNSQKTVIPIVLQTGEVFHLNIDDYLNESRSELEKIVFNFMQEQ